MWQLSKRTLQLSGLVASLSLSACYHPPYNRFEPHNRTIKPMVKGASVGAVAGALAGNTLVGVAVGGAAGSALGIYRSSKTGIINELQDQSIQYVQYGDTRTLIVPTDKYFLYSSPRINELCYPGLANIVKLMSFYPGSTVFVAGFTDNVGSRKRKQQLSQAQAEAMVSLLWANGIKAELLNAQGYGDQHPIGDNNLIHGSAFNRRLEIQWMKADAPKVAKLRYFGWKK